MSKLTKLAIYKTFIDLLNKDPLDKITVQDICDECGINRNTFYYYFDDKYAVLKEIFELEKKRSIDETHLCTTWKDSFKTAADFALKNKKAVYHIYNSISRDELESYLRDVIKNLLKIFVDDQSKGKNVSLEDKEMIITLAQSAIVGLIIEWLSNGMSKDASYFIDQVDRLLNGVIEWVINKASSSK